MRTAYDAIVVGCGGIGSAAAYWLSRRLGKDVLVLEQFQLGHARAASDDHSKIIRLSYDAPHYTALTPQTFVVWRHIEQESGVQVVFKTGGLDLAPPGSEQTLASYAAAMDAHGIPYERLNAADAMRRWPQWRLPEGSHVLYQADGGILDIRKAAATQAALARARGATILDNTRVHEVRATGDTVQVRTDAHAFSSRFAVIAADAWTNQVLAGLGARWPLTVTAEQVTYFATPHLRAFAPDRFPIWIWHGEGDFYGFPVHGEVATKAGQDVGGDIVEPDAYDWQPNPKPLARLTEFLTRHCPDFLGPVLYTKPCFYTMPPDREFIIDTLPDFPHVAVAIGAGHAGKFSCLIGQILSQLVIDGRTPYPIEAFRIQRPALLQAGYPPNFHR
jgi:sarcosine oxidase